MAFGMVAGPTAGVGMGLGGFLFGHMMARTHQFFPSAIWWAVVVAIAFVTTASIAGTVSERRRGRLRRIMERLVAEVQRSIDDFAETTSTVSIA